MSFMYIHIIYNIYTCSKNAWHIPGGQVRHQKKRGQYCKEILLKPKYFILSTFIACVGIGTY